MSVVSLRGGAELAPRGEPDPETVRILEEYLERARSGEICGVVVVGVHADDAVSSHAHASITYRLIGAMQARVVEFSNHQLAEDE